MPLLVAQKETTMGLSQLHKYPGPCLAHLLIPLVPLELPPGRREVEEAGTFERTAVCWKSVGCVASLVVIRPLPCCADVGNPL